MYLKRAATIGDTTEILPAYDHMTGARTRIDEITGCECTILRRTRSGDDFIVMIKGHPYEEYVNPGRMKPIAYD